MLLHFLYVHMHTCISYIFIQFATFAYDKFKDCVLQIIFFHPAQTVNGRFREHSSTPTFSTVQYDPFSDSNADVVVVTDPPIVCPSAPEAVSYINVCI